MALTFANLGTNSNATDGTSVATASFTPTSGNLILMWLMVAKTTTPPTDTMDLSHSSITGVEPVPGGTIAFASTSTLLYRLSLLRGIGGGGAATAAFGNGETCHTFAWSIIDVGGAATGRGDKGVRQVRLGSGDAGTALSTAAFANNLAASAVAVGWGTTRNNAITQEAGWTELGDAGNSTAPVVRVETAYNLTFDTTPTGTQTIGTADWGGIAAEIAQSLEILQPITPSGMTQAVHRASNW